VFCLTVVTVSRTFDYVSELFSLLHKTCVRVVGLSSFLAIPNTTRFRSRTLEFGCVVVGWTGSNQSLV
jgi:hypothetical protein